MDTPQASPERPPQNSFDFRAFAEEYVKSISRTDGKPTGDGNSLDKSWVQSRDNVDDEGRRLRNWFFYFDLIYQLYAFSVHRR